MLAVLCNGFRSLGKQQQQKQNKTGFRYFIMLQSVVFGLMWSEQTKDGYGHEGQITNGNPADRS